MYYKYHKCLYDVKTIQTLNRDFVKCVNKKNGFRAWFLIATIQKDYYKKAFVVENRFGVRYLFSYQTLVAVYDTANKVFYRTYGDYTVTTMNHINDFRMENGLDKLCKKEWLETRTTTDIPFRDEETERVLFNGTPYIIQ